MLEEFQIEIHAIKCNNTIGNLQVAWELKRYS